MLAIVASPVFLIPGVVVVLVAVFSAPILAAISRGGGSRQGSAMPSTEEAAYEPVAQPDERRA